MQFPLNISKGDQKDYEYGFVLGFFLAEGNFTYRNRSFTKNSLEHLRALARKNGMSLQEYLKYTTNIRRVVLSIGQSDFERGYIDIVQKHFKFATPSKIKHTNGYVIRSSDLALIHLIKEYIEGNDSHTKHLKNEAYNRTKKFLEGIMDGFLAGDGSYSKKGDLFSVGITTNYRLYNDLIFLSKALGYDLHLRKSQIVKSLSSDKPHYLLRLSIFKNWHRHTAWGLAKDRVKSVENTNEKETFNLILKPLYPDNGRHAKFNHLYFVAYGIMVSDATVSLKQKKIILLSICLPNCIMKSVVCPVCGKKGSLQIKYIKTTSGKKIPYYYVAHYEMLKGETRVLNWHYIGKSLPENLIKVEGEQK